LENNILNYKIATRYTDALIDIAQKQNKLDEVEAQIRELKKIFRADNNRLLNFVSDMTLSKKIKKETISEIFKRLGVMPLITDFFMIFFDNRRGNIIRYIFKSFYYRYNRIKNVRTATVQSVVKLTEAEVNKIVEILTKKTGKKILLKQELNPEIVAGFIIKYGDNTINCAVAREFEILEKQFLLN